MRRKEWIKAVSAARDALQLAVDIARSGHCKPPLKPGTFEEVQTAVDSLDIALDREQVR